MNKTVAALLLISCAMLNSCNTTIGLYRDAKEGYRWTRDKIQESQHQDSGYDHAPTY